jgi:hypothetical protein
LGFSRYIQNLLN